MRRAATITGAFVGRFLNRLLKSRQIDPGLAERRLSKVIPICAAVLAGSVLSGIWAARAQDTAAKEAARRAAVLAWLPADAAKRVFGSAISASPSSAQAIGAYSKGCLAGATELPADGRYWQVMRPSRNRAWGHPVLIGFLEQLAAQADGTGWPGLLVGDIGQPRGGPMLTGHESHQIGLDADIWLTPMPDRRLSVAERDNMSATNVVAEGGDDIDPNVWHPQHRQLLEAAARGAGTARIFVNPAIKRALCREAGADRDWLRRIRPWWGHDYHFHLRLRCPRGETECHDQAEPPAGDGCGAELDWWFTPEAKHPKPGPRERPLRVSDLPATCAALVAR
jgi:penicillin-insensitive murein endopeptidase